MNALPIGEVLELIHPDDREMIHGAISESMANTATPYHQVAYRFRHKDGCYRWFLDKFKVLRSPEDQPVARIGSVSDITGIKLTEETLRLTSQQLQSILDNTPALIYTKDLEGRLQLVNHEFETLFGRSREELIGKTSHDLLPKAVADAHVANDQEVIRTKTAVSMEESTGKNGDGKIFLSVKFPLVNPEGDVYGICGISSDITDRKRTELAIVESEEKYRTVFTTEKDALFLIDKETMRILDVNDSACQLYGYSRDEFLTMRNVDVSAEPEETLRAARDFTGRIELRYHKKKDGTVFPIDISANQYHLQGRMVILAAIRDISDQQRIRVEIEKKNQQLLKLNAEKDKFFSIISHDLRSPFNSLLGLTEIMADDLHELTGDQIRKMAGGIRSSAKKLINLVENLLEWSRLQRGISSFNPVPVRLSEAISIAMEQAQLAADRKAILVYRSIPENMVVPLDMHMFQSLMNNLVFNAVKFTPRGGEITIGARQVAGDSIEISVSDNGIGMRRETVENLFQIDKEISSPGTEGEPGSGLGLLLCKDFVGRHGGTLRVESELEKGSVFIFTLPLT
jgi:PAS domain S-box-containing protein